jgi:hypothetical protein
VRVGIELPAAVPETDLKVVGRWAAENEDAGFESAVPTNEAGANA